MKPEEEKKEEGKEEEEIIELGKRKEREFDKDSSIEDAINKSKLAVEESRKRLKRFEEETAKLKKVI